MFAEEWPLMFFTLLTQLAVGSYLFFVIIRTFSGSDSNLAVNATKKGMFLIGPIMLLALILSVFHLGDPFGAYRSILNLGSSWLSREIVFAGGFFFLWIVSYLMERKGNWSKAVGWITALVGLGAIFSMASIYATSVKPAWTDVNTYFAFYGTTIVFGAAASIIAVLFSKEEKSDRLISLLKGIGIAGIAAVIIQLVYLPVYTSGLLTDGGEAGMASVAILKESYGIASIIRWLLTVTGLAAIGWALYRRMDARNKSFVYAAALIFVLVGEFLGRYIFYGTGVSMFIG